MTDGAYIVSGYVVCLGGLFAYAVSLLTRARRARRRAAPAASLDSDPPRDHERPARP